MLSIRALFGLFALSLLTATACGETTSKDAKLGETCATTDDCGSSLACADYTCHSECRTTADCKSLGGGLCLLTPAGGRICRSPDETGCVRNADCPGLQACASDQKCRDQCQTATDCAKDDVCTAGVCAGPTDVVNGQLPGATTAPTAKACLNHNECAADEVCLMMVCSKP